MIFIAGRLWDHFLMISEAVVKREGKEERKRGKAGGERSRIRAKLFLAVQINQEDQQY